MELSRTNRSWCIEDLSLSSILTRSKNKSQRATDDFRKNLRSIRIDFGPWTRESWGRSCMTCTNDVSCSWLLIIAVATQAALLFVSKEATDKKVTPRTKNIIKYCWCLSPLLVQERIRGPRYPREKTFNGSCSYLWGLSYGQCLLFSCPAGECYQLILLTTLEKQGKIQDSIPSNTALMCSDNVIQLCSIYGVDPHVNTNRTVTAAVWFFGASLYWCNTMKEAMNYMNNDPAKDDIMQHIYRSLGSTQSPEGHGPSSIV